MELEQRLRLRLRLLWPTTTAAARTTATTIAGRRLVKGRQGRVGRHSRAGWLRPGAGPDGGGFALVRGVVVDGLPEGVEPVNVGVVKPAVKMQKRAGV